MKTLSLPGFVLNEKGPLVQIKEIRLSNKDWKNPEYTNLTNEISKAILTTKQLPDSIKTNLVKALYFYSLPYNTRDAWFLEVSGVYLNNSSTETEEWSNLTLKADGNFLARQTVSNMGNTGSNLRFFTVKFPKVNPDFNSLEVEWNFQGNNGRAVYKNEFRTTTYSFFDSKPREHQGYNPERVASEAFWSYYSNRSTTNRIKLSKELIDKLIWAKKQKDIVIYSPYLSYLGDYKGFKNVVTVEMNYILEPKESDKVDGSQIFYLIEQNGVWKIIDISSFRKN